MASQRQLEVWGGFECTIARVGATYRNQIEETGHAGRMQDLDALRALGIRTLRYPALWEMISPQQPDACEWRWQDERFEHIRGLGMRPIVGLLHHGSGPRYTSLIDPKFPELFARHAERVAERYPWVDLFTPVNEPLTTARFSALYGHWYPHERNMGAFLRAVVNQCKATVLAMRAIRRITPGAQLIQTEDVGKTFGTPALAEQARFENQRRWLSLDLLCGKVDTSHPWYAMLIEHQIPEADLDLLRDAEAAPDVIGVNHYLTSERFLDRNWRRYPPQFRGGNGYIDYADVEAVRVDLPMHQIGPAARLREVLERYRRPVAVTEVHLGCSRDEQLRWLSEVWTAAETLRAEGQDVRAVTLWSLVGAVDWNSLLVSRHAAYEPGAFDIRAPLPRPTALARAAASLASTGAFTHPALNGPGWWRRPERLHWRSSRTSAPRQATCPLLITGRTGTLGGAFGRICTERGLPHVLTLRSELDITDQRSVYAALAAHRPWAVVNTAGYVRVERAEREPDACLEANTIGAEVLAAACAKLAIPLVTFSSDLVFDGQRGRPYVESDPTCPTGIYGASKARAESAVLSIHPQTLVIRTSAFFSPWDRHNFAYAVLAAPDHAGALRASPDIVSPTYVPDLVHAALDLLIDGEHGLWHLANHGELSWAEFAARLCATVGLPSREVPAPPASVRNNGLASEKAWIMPPLDSAIARFVRDCAFDLRAGPRLIAAE